MAVPAMSSGLPIRRSGADASMCSRNASRVAAIIFDSNGPGAMALTVMDGASLLAKWRGIWGTAAFDGEYEYVSICEGSDGRTPGGPGVVDEDFEPVLPGGQLFGQAPTAVLGGQVGRKRDALAPSRQLSRHFIADLGLSGRDVDLGSGIHVPRSDHEADAP